MTPEAEKYFDSLKETYASQRPKSEALHKKACRYMPGGDTRTATFFLPFPEKERICMMPTGINSWTFRITILR